VRTSARCYCSIHCLLLISTQFILHDGLPPMRLIECSEWCFDRAGRCAAILIDDHVPWVCPAVAQYLASLARRTIALAPRLHVTATWVVVWIVVSIELLAVTRTALSTDVRRWTDRVESWKTSAPDIDWMTAKCHPLSSQSQRYNLLQIQQLVHTVHVAHLVHATAYQSYLHAWKHLLSWLERDFCQMT